MSAFVTSPDVALLRQAQRALMSETCQIRDMGNLPVFWIEPGTVLATSDIPCRKHQQIANADTADPEDADTRSLAIWRFTVPYEVSVQVAYRVIFTGNLGETLVGSVGEELDHDTWKIATRFAISIPKLAVPQTLLVLYRDDDLDGSWTALAAQPVQIVFDRLQPEESEVRFSPAAYSAQKGGRIIGDLDLDIRVGDRFRYDGKPGIVVAIIDGNPDQTEARFMLDLGGV